VSSFFTMQNWPLRLTQDVAAGGRAVAWSSEARARRLSTEAIGELVGASGTPAR
jgi:hypothetical protein